MGYDGWTRSPYHNTIRLDGQYVHEAGIVPRTKTPAAGAAMLPMADGGTLYQVPLADTTGVSPFIVSAYRWPLDLQADTEAGWFLLESCSKRGAAVELIDFDYEVESFTAGPSTTSFILPRPTASSAWAGFPTSEYPTQAYVNGVAQTVVESAPGAGEVQVVGRNVTTPALSNGDVLEIHYVAAFQVVVPPLPTRLARFGDLVMTVELTEALARSA
jgi:hypothetical protein